jgi:hypothetical protein
MLPQLSLTGGGELSVQIFPDTPVEVGETWRHAVQLLPFGQDVPVNVNSSRTLVSFVEHGEMGVAKIAGYTEARLQGTPTDMSLTEGKIRAGVTELRKTVTSTEFFDATQGRLIRGDYQIGISGRVSSAVGDEKAESGAEGRIHVTVRAR